MSYMEVNLEELEHMSFNKLSDLLKLIKMQLYQKGLYPIKGRVSKEIEIYRAVEAEFSKKLDAIPIMREAISHAHYQAHVMNQ